MLVGANREANRTSRQRPPGNLRGEEALLHPLMALQRVVDARKPQASVFDGMDDGFERCGLRVVVAAADEDAVAAGGKREDSRRGNGMVIRNRLHLEIVAEDDALETELFPKQIVHDVP